MLEGKSTGFELSQCGRVTEPQAEQNYTGNCPKQEGMHAVRQ